MQDLEVNSAGWWEQYFKESWDAHGGREQTRHFMERIVASLPVDVFDLLHSTPDVRILDWGCAFGDGVDVLAKALPRARVSGLDFASRAIEEARKTYPQYEFLHSPLGAIPADVDAIFCSNCLEHFDTPMAVLRSQIVHCRRIYVALVPYDESPLHPQHRFRFCVESFPERIGPFERAVARTVEVESRYWPGKQLLVIYTARAATDREFMNRLAFELRAARRQLAAANEAVEQLRDGVTRYSASFAGGLAQFRNQRAWQIMLLIRKLYSHAVQEGWAGRRKLIRFFAALPFRGVPPLTEYDLRFERLEDYVSNVHYQPGNDETLAGQQIVFPDDPGSTHT